MECSKRGSFIYDFMVGTYIRHKSSIHGVTLWRAIASYVMRTTHPYKAVIFFFPFT